MSQSKIIQSFCAPFKPPFTGLASVLWVYFVYCFLVYPDSYILRGDFPDTDDYTYLNQTIDWLKGQSWFDNVQHRLAPPEGVPIHFTRFVQIPLALLILLFKTLGLSMSGAATVTAIIYPPILLAVLFVVVRWASEPFLPRDWTRVTAYVTIFSGPALCQYILGHVDHHGLEAILIVFSIGCAVRMFTNPSEMKWPLWGASVLALSMCIALEVLPWVIILSACVGLSVIVRGRVMAHAASVFALTLYVMSFVFLFLYRGPSGWQQEDLLAYSIVYVVLSGLIAVCCIGVSVVSGFAPAWARWGVGVLLGGVAGFAFFSHYPDLLAGPYGAMDKNLAAAMLSQIIEAQPLSTLGRGPMIIIGYVLFQLIGFSTCIAAIKADDKRLVWSWLMLAILIGVALMLGIFYQIRLLRYASLFSIIPMAFLLCRGWGWIAERYKGRQRFWAEVGLLFLVGPLPTLFIPAVFDGRSFNTGVLMYPVSSQAGMCNMATLELVLGMPEIYGNRKLTIMNMVDQGPELLFRSHHNVMAAPYHTNVKGNMESIAFFKAAKPEEAEAVARRNNIDLVLICRNVSKMYIGDKGPDKVQLDSSGRASLSDKAVFVERLIYHKPPSWLREVDFQNMDNFLVYEVKSSFPEREKQKGAPAKTSATKKQGKKGSSADEPLKLQPPADLKHGGKAKENLDSKVTPKISAETKGAAKTGASDNKALGNTKVSPALSSDAKTGGSPK